MYKKRVAAKKLNVISFLCKTAAESLYDPALCFVETVYREA